MSGQRRVFGKIEVLFDSAYLIFALGAGLFMALAPGSAARFLAGCMTLTLAAGDAFHLIPRMAAILSHDEGRYERAMGLGKLITSITMTAFYILLAHIGLLLFNEGPGGKFLAGVYILSAVRIILCLLPQNGWFERRPPVGFAILRNIPFALLGIMVAWLFAANTGKVTAVDGMWIAIALSFGFYIPVVLFSNKNPRLGMLMLPKTLAYVFIVVICMGI